MAKMQSSGLYPLFRVTTFPDPTAERKEKHNIESKQIRPLRPIKIQTIEHEHISAAANNSSFDNTPISTPKSVPQSKISSSKSDSVDNRKAIVSTPRTRSLTTENGD